MHGSTYLYRIIDANANRAREGLRTVEEYLRLAQNSTELTFRLKSLRHEITETISKLRIEDQMIQARASDSDVGATDPAGSEAIRTSAGDIVVANLRRSQEALRVLEEFSKMISQEAACAFKKLRFSTYTIERDIRLRAPERQKPGGERDQK
ncbi:MAG: thiamine-phosphate pyrophosphorylase [Candidatus Abyssobacteria bacterium SURF_5]|uniref:Thiamine-phosphate pyrophosphorylase n=1 Tax=Abyssobacteria bacterium (strain SURF_5) TaxID=2093360 RepID=A0A3A4NNT2_ABYX5|nr:MAG: thiamine-phosphate pyrophosphorylase [Candidatus Abyssubacteria bacterium SURF_5]